MRSMISCSIANELVLVTALEQRAAPALSFDAKLAGSFSAASGGRGVPRRLSHPWHHATASHATGGGRAIERHPSGALVEMAA